MDPRQTPATPAPLPATAVTSLARAREALAEAALAGRPAPRYAAAHVAALRATAAVLAVRTRPASRRSQRNAWTLLALVAPELEEWAVFFSAGAPKRAAAEAGLSRAVSTREADDLLRDSGRFLALVERMLGVTPPQSPSQTTLPPAQAS
jgi:SAV_6107-like HEPN